MVRMLAALVGAAVLLVSGSALGSGSGGASGCTITQSFSAAGTTPATIEFVNETAATVSVYWLDFTGARQLWFRLAGGRTQLQGTYIGHAWLVTDLAGTCIGYVLSTQTYQRYVISGGTAPPPPTSTTQPTPKPPAPPKPKPALPTMRAVKVSSRPTSPIAGSTFTVSASIVLSTGKTVSAAAACSAKLAGAALRGTGSGGCTFRIPRTAAGKKLAVTVRAAYGGAARSQTVRYTVRAATVALAKPKPSTSPSAGSDLGCRLAGVRFYGAGPGNAPVCFTLSVDRKTMLEYAYEPCAAARSALSESRSTKHVTIKPDGTFAATTTALAAGEAGIGFVNVTFAGRIRSSTAAGSLTLDAGAGGKLRCAWSARRAG